MIPRFDYDKQDFIADGVCSPIIPGRQNPNRLEFFPCPRCQAPAVMLWFDSYRERYECTDPACRHRFSVN